MTQAGSKLIVEQPQLQGGCLLDGVIPVQTSSCRSTVQLGNVKYSTLQYITVQYSTVQYSIAQYSTVHSSTVQLGNVKLKRVKIERWSSLFSRRIVNGWCFCILNTWQKATILLYTEVLKKRRCMSFYKLIWLKLDWHTNNNKFFCLNGGGVTCGLSGKRLYILRKMFSKLLSYCSLCEQTVGGCSINTFMIHLFIHWVGHPFVQNLQDNVHLKP